MKFQKMLNSLMMYFMFGKLGLDYTLQQQNKGENVDWCHS